MSRRQAVDDLVLNSRHARGEQTEARAHSASPVKKSRLTPFWDQHTDSTATSLGDIVSSSPMTPKQLKSLIKSPISQKLHISRSSYLIPIPFQLQFPPKLSNASSPDKSLSSSPSKLVFTGQTYEPMDSDSASDCPPDDSFLLSPKISGAFKPPLVSSSNKKVARFVNKTQAVPLDQLSLIEEGLSNGTSRSTSVEFDHNNSKRHNSLSQKLAKESSPKLRSAAIPMSMVQGVSIQSEKASPHCYKSSIASSGNTPNFVPKSLSESCVKALGKGHKPTFSLSDPPHNRPLPSLPQEPGQNHLPQSRTIHDIQRFPHGKQASRDFTNASELSSVSSFSSFGDVLNLNQGRTALALPIQRPTNLRRKAPDANQTYRRNSQASDVSIPPSSSNKPTLGHRKSVSTNTLAAPTAGYDDGANPSYKFPLQDTASQNTGEYNKVRRHSSYQMESELPAADDNRGAGMGFNFPNSASNSSNNAKLRISKHNNDFEPHTPKNRALHRSVSGRIEIPSLENLESQYYDANSTMGSALTVPSPAAVSHLKTLLESTQGDSDTDSSFNSQFQKLRTTQNRDTEAEQDDQPDECRTPITNAPKQSQSDYVLLKSLPRLPNPGQRTSANSSPVRHARLRSICSMDFINASQHQTPPLAPVSLQQDPAHLNKPLGSVGHTRSKSQDAVNALGVTDTISPSLTLPLNIREPPKKVTYAVDFKAPHQEQSTNSRFEPAPHTTYHLQVKPKIPSSSSSRYTTPEQSIVASSYKSSRSCQDTASTAPTETGSVVIDLTKESYNVCMVNRHDSVLSYKSVIEQREGKDVEVVLVEEDEDDAKDGRIEDDEDEYTETFSRDDLLSIYLRYMGQWDTSEIRTKPLLGFSDSRPPTKKIPINWVQPPRLGNLRNVSEQSLGSNCSDVLINSWASSSEANFQTKSLAPLRKDMAPSLQPISTNHFIQGRAPLQVLAEKPTEDLSFDYASSGSYDFQTFMKLRIK